MDMTALYRISYGMYIVGAMDGQRPVGCVINTCMQITAEPVTLAISVNKDNYTHAVIEKIGLFGISVLSEQTPAPVVSVFGFRSSKEYDKYSVCSHELVQGVPIVQDNTCAGFVCRVKGSHDMGTHTVFFAEVVDAVQGKDLPPMTYEYYHKVIKGKAPAKAPTYQKEVKENQPVSTQSNYVCTVCGYVHEGSLENEPSDYVCPVCGVPKSKFRPA